MQELGQTRGQTHSCIVSLILRCLTNGLTPLFSLAAFSESGLAKNFTRACLPHEPYACGDLVVLSHGYGRCFDVFFGVCIHALYGRDLRD